VSRRRDSLRIASRFQGRCATVREFDGERVILHAITGDVRVAPFREPRSLVEKALDLRDHLGAARLVVALASLARIARDDVGSVERVVEASPARFRGVQRVAGIRERDDELGSADVANLFVHIHDTVLPARGLRKQIPNPLQEGGIGRDIERPALGGAMPAVDLALKRIAEREQSLVRGPRSRTMAASPCQKFSGVMPVWGAASVAINSARGAAIFNPLASMLFISTFFSSVTASFAMDVQ
jgi:hypothetical protein